MDQRERQTKNEMVDVKKEMHLKGIDGCDAMGWVRWRQAVQKNGKMKDSGAI